MSAIGMTQTVLLAGLAKALADDGILVDKALQPATQAWIRDVAKALHDAEMHVPIQPSGIRKDVAVEILHERETAIPRTNLGRRADDRR